MSNKNISINKLFKQGVSDSSYYLIANAGSKLLGFLIIPVVIRQISVEEFADYDLFLLISNFLQIIITLGIDSGVAILIAESKNNFEKLSFYYVFSLIISLFSLLLVVFFVCFSFIFFDELFKLSFKIWVLILLYLLFRIINYNTFNFLRWEAKAKQAAFINLLSYLVGMIAGILFIFYIKNKIEYYLLGLILGSAIAALFSLYIARNYIIKFKIINNSYKYIKELLILSLPFVPNYIGNNLMQLTDRVVILILFEKYELGLYAIVFRLAQIPQFLFNTVSNGFLPVMYKNYKTLNGKKLIKNFFHFYVIIIPILFVITYFSSQILLEIFAGENYIHIAYLLPMALSSILFVNSVRYGGFGYMIMRKTYYIMYVTFICVLFNFLFSLSFGYYMGIAGIILGTLLAGINRTYIHIFLSEKLYKFEYNFKLITLISSLTFFLTLLIIWNNN